MRRTLLVVGLVVCTLASTAGAVLWVRSFYRLDSVMKLEPDGFLWLAISNRGKVYVGTVEMPPNIGAGMNDLTPGEWKREAKPSERPDFHNLPTEDVRIGLAGFRYYRGDIYVGITYWVAEVPDWLFVLPMFAWPVAAVLRARRRRLRVRRGLCLGCGYDLRASTSRCPACGRPVPTPAIPASATRPGSIAGSSCRLPDSFSPPDACLGKVWIGRIGAAVPTPPPAYGAHHVRRGLTSRAHGSNSGVRLTARPRL